MSLVFVLVVKKKRGSKIPEKNREKSSKRTLVPVDCRNPPRPGTPRQANKQRAPAPLPPANSTRPSTKLGWHTAVQSTACSGYRTASQKRQDACSARSTCPFLCKTPGYRNRRHIKNADTRTRKKYGLRIFFTATIYIACCSLGRLKEG